MRWKAFGLRALFLSAALALVLCGPLANEARAQNNNNNNNNNNNGGAVAGVTIDANGVVQRRAVVDFGGRLMAQRIMMAKAAMPNEVRRFSSQRCVSLNRLEAALGENNGAMTDEMRYLAGLLRVQYVFTYPQTDDGPGDIVLVGPAEGWVTNPVNRVVGMTSGRPTLQLQDLVVALRAFPPNGEGVEMIGCSIDPTEQGLAEMQRFLRQIGSIDPRGNVEFIVNGLRTSLGMQNVTVNGVPADTHFAQVLVEADYRMKCIGIGVEPSPVRMPSYIELASPTQVSRNAMARWWFVPDYECVRRSEDGLAMELVGNGVKLLGAAEMVSHDGQRHQAASGNRASQAFVNGFTKKYSELAQRAPIFAELRNMIDLAVVAAYVQSEDLYAEAGWDMELFGSEETFAVRTFAAPRHVESTVAAVWKGSRLMTPIGGGVEIRADMALDQDNLLPDERGKVGQLRKETTIELAEGQWWWDRK